MPSNELLSKVPGNTAHERIRNRNALIKEEQQNLTPPLVPRAYPPTTMAEVPPGTQQYRAAPAPKPTTANVPLAGEAIAEQEKVEAEGTKQMKDNAAKDAEKLEAAHGETQKK